MKHTFTKNGSKWLRIMPDVTNGQPELVYGNDDIRPYWKSSGTGSESLIIEREYAGSYLIRAINQTEGAASGKETWVHLDKEIADKIGAFLQGKAS